jgi:hypothetical protein
VGQSGDDLVGSALMGENPNIHLQPFGEGFVLKTGVFMNHGQRHMVSSLKWWMKSVFH